MTRQLNKDELREVYMKTMDALGIRPDQMPGWFIPAAVMFIRCYLHAFCRANGIEPPPGNWDM